MTDLDAVLNAHQASLDCLNIVGDLLEKSRKSAIFHNTIFFNKSLEQAQHLLLSSKEELADSVIVSLLSTFERIVFDHLGSSGKTKDQGLNDVIKHFKKRVSTRTYRDAELLCGYRHWVAHGKRWPQPSAADPANTHKCLTDFLKQARLM
ncbi:hypothetical protein [Candidatus Nitrospira nitrificans]|uniref:Uncharacterized protein n=1 Tax=Candidatus Nitrospira nitrificans TaxID=1742973 RepID=A0A0S4LCZ8_9BACT|nr:hypothetical protein [Candidatus Nitrospira nitrificans]CUS34734.1 hypothetical protein COMA2_180084 [Candidatus Nitrospira nitrificans]